MVCVTWCIFVDMKFVFVGGGVWNEDEDCFFYFHSVFYVGGGVLRGLWGRGGG